jgi:hypothetical protein
MLGKGITQNIVLSRFPCPIFPCPFTPSQKQDGSQKNGGTKISSFYIFASIFLRSCVRLASRSRSILMFGCGLPHWDSAPEKKIFVQTQRPGNNRKPLGSGEILMFKISYDFG